MYYLLKKIVVCMYLWWGRGGKGSREVSELFLFVVAVFCKQSLQAGQLYGSDF